MKSAARLSKEPPSLRRRFLKQALFFALALYGVLLGLGGLIFLVSHIPPKAVNLDAVISALVFLENVLVAPRKLLLWLWPWETIASGLIWVLTVINSLVWGAVLATLKVAWQKAAVRGQRSSCTDS